MTGPGGLELRSRKPAEDAADAGVDADPGAGPDAVSDATPAGGPAPGSPPLLFVHGAMAGAWCWDERFLPWFSDRGHHVFALSLRGHGASPGRETLHSLGIRDYVEDVAAVMEFLPAPPVLVGHSMGGFVVQRLLDGAAAGKSPRAAAAVLMAPVPPGGLFGPMASMAVWDPRLFWEMAFSHLAGIRSGAVDLFREVLVSGALPQEDIARYRGLLGPESRRAIRDMLCGDACRRNEIGDSAPGDPGEDASGEGILPPVLVLGAGEDRIIPPSYAHAAARRCGVNAEIMPGMAHAMMLDPLWKHAACRIDDWIRAGFPQPATKPASRSGALAQIHARRQRV